MRKSGHRDNGESRTRSTPEKLMLPSETAEVLRVKEYTLEKWRILGRGPRFVKLENKNVAYRPSDVADYQEQNLRSSTSGR